METQAQTAYGVILKKETDTPGTYADWGLEITNVTPPGFTRDAIDATHMQSPNGWGEVIMSAIKRQKPFSIEVNWVPAETFAILAAINEGIGNWQILFPDNSYVTVAAGLNDFSPSGAAPDGKLAATAEFTPSGEPVWEPAS